MSAIHIFLCVFQLPVCLVDYSTIVPCGDLFSIILVKLATLFPQMPFLVGVWLESARSGVFGDLEGEGQEAIPLKIMAIKCPSGGSFSSLPSQPVLLPTRTTTKMMRVGQRDTAIQTHLPPALQGGPFAGPSDHGAPLIY